MKITNDVVSFESKDLVAFSESALAALTLTAGELTLTAGESRTIEEVLSDAVNGAIAASVISRVNYVLESLRPTAEKIAGTLSDEGARAAVANFDDSL